MYILFSICWSRSNQFTTTSILFEYISYLFSVDVVRCGWMKNFWFSRKVGRAAKERGKKNYAYYCANHGGGEQWIGSYALDKISRLVMPNRRWRSTTMFLAHRRQLILTATPTVPRKKEQGEILPVIWRCSTRLHQLKSTWTYLASCRVAWPQMVTGNLAGWRRGNSKTEIRCACHTPRWRWNFPFPYRRPRRSSQSEEWYKRINSNVIDTSVLNVETYHIRGKFKNCRLQVGGHLKVLRFNLLLSVGHWSPAKDLDGKHGTSGLGSWKQKTSNDRYRTLFGLRKMHGLLTPNP